MGEETSSPVSVLTTNYITGAHLAAFSACLTEHFIFYGDDALTRESQAMSLATQWEMRVCDAK